MKKQCYLIRAYGKGGFNQLLSVDWKDRRQKPLWNLVTLVYRCYVWLPCRAKSALRQSRETDSCRDAWNVRNGSNVPKILHSVGERVDCVLLLVLVVLLNKHICDLILNKKHCKSLCWGKYRNLLMLLQKTGCISCC